MDWPMKIPATWDIGKYDKVRSLCQLYCSMHILVVQVRLSWLNITPKKRFFFMKTREKIRTGISFTHWLRLKKYTPKMSGQKYQLISHKINIRHPHQLKKWKSLEPFWSYQLNSTANPAHLPQNWAKLAKLAKLAVLFSW